MSLKAGIIGLPNVGKSTLFNAITRQKVVAVNYPFATIEPNVGTVVVPDKRIDFLEQIYNAEKVIPTTFEFIDIAGLVKGASNGEGLGNKFLSHIREVDAICQVVRCFDNKSITHVEGQVDPVRDIEIINTELSLADLEIVIARLNRIEKRAISSKNQEELKEVEILKKLKTCLEQGIRTYLLDLSQDDKKIIKSLNLITLKPLIYLCNINESDIASEENEYIKRVKAKACEEKAEVVCICAQIESELADLDEAEKEIFLNDLNITSSGLDKVIVATYTLLGLETYFTAGPKEIHAWTYAKGAKAPECAGIIHSDFERGFIKAEIFNYKDLVKYGSEKQIRENGALRLEGKDYIMADGDVCHFRFNV